MNLVGFLFSIEGCEYVFGDGNTGGTYTYASDDWSPQWTILTGFLDLETAASWQERARSDGAFEGGSVEFVLHDAPAPSGSLAGQPVCTALLTKSPALVPSTRLAATIDDDDATLTVADFTALGLSTPCTIVVEREAIRIASRVGNVLTVAAGGRGYLGSFGAPHVVDADRLYHPEVWPTLPFALRRRAILWAATDAGAVVPLWRGTVAKKRLHRDGAMFVVSCESILDVHANATLGDEYATTRFRGVNTTGVQVGVRIDSGASIGIARRPWEGPTVSTMSEACARAQADTIARLGAVGITGTSLQVRVEGDGVRARMDAASGVASGALSLRVGLQVAQASFVETSGTRRAEVVVEGVPQVLVATAPTYDNNILAVTTVARLPSSWAQTVGTTYAGARTTLAPVLRGTVDADHVVDVYVAEVVSTGTAGSGTAAPYVRGAARVLPLEGAAPRITNGGYFVQYVDTDVLLKVAGRVVTDHWAAGLANVIGERGVLRSQVTRRDWDFATIPDVIAATFGPLARREWTFDGSVRLGDLLREELTLNGCALSLRASRLAIVPVGPATASAAVAATLGELDAHDLAVQDWEEADEEQITTVEADLDGTPVRVNDVRTVGRYGTGRTVSVKLRGRDAARRGLADPVALASALLGRVVGPYSDPVGVMTFHVVATEWVDRLFIGDYVDISDWLVPDGTGGRGVGNAAALAAVGELSSRAQVRGRTVDLGANKLALELLLFPQVYGYAPAARVESSDATAEVSLLAAWINGVGDYTNPDAGDGVGGATAFRVNDVVVLRQMDTTTETIDGPYTIASITSNVVVLTTAITGAVRTSINGGAWWDLEFARLSEIITLPSEARQLGYAYCGDDVTGIIDGESTYPVRAWAP